MGNPSIPGVVSYYVKDDIYNELEFCRSPHIIDISTVSKHTLFVTQFFAVGSTIHVGNELCCRVVEFRHQFVPIWLECLTVTAPISDSDYIRYTIEMEKREEGAR